MIITFVNYMYFATGQFPAQTLGAGNYGESFSSQLSGHKTSDRSEMEDCSAGFRTGSGAPHETTEFMDNTVTSKQNSVTGRDKFLSPSSIYLRPMLSECLKVLKT